MIWFSKPIFTVKKISHRLAEPRGTTYIFFGVFDIPARSWCCDTTKMCYIFGQILPFHSELRKDKIETWLRLPPAVFLSPPTFWEHVTSLNQGLSSLGWKTLGTGLPTAAYSPLKISTTTHKQLIKTSEMTICHVNDKIQDPRSEQNLNLPLQSYSPWSPCIINYGVKSRNDMCAIIRSCSC